MRGPNARLLAPALLVVALVSGLSTSCAAASTVKVSSAPQPCATSNLRAFFAEIAGSQGAGNVSYMLQLRNDGKATCTVSGLPSVLLVGRKGNLPTHVSEGPTMPKTPPTIKLAKGSSAYAEARFSPDVPGPGEQGIGPCEQTAYAMRVTIRRHATVLIAPVSPPTPVCEHGSMTMTVLGAKLPTV